MRRSDDLLARELGEATALVMGTRPAGISIVVLCRVRTGSGPSPEHTVASARMNSARRSVKTFASATASVSFTMDVYQHVLPGMQA